MTQEQKIIKNKLGLLKLAQTLGSVSEACKVLGFSRDSFYRFKEMYDTGGETALAEISRKKPNLKNRADPRIEQAVVEFAIEQPAYGQVRVANELKKRAISVSPAGVRTIWLRHDLQTFQLRLKALSAKVAQEGIILTEDQVRALEKAKLEKEAHGEIETEHPGYLGSQDTYYVGNLKGRADLSANLHRHLQQARFREAVRPQERAHGGGHAQRSRPAVLRRAWRAHATDTDRSRQRVLRQPGVARVCVVSRSGEYRAHANEGQESADQRDLRTLPSDDSKRVLCQRLPTQAVSLTR